MKILPFPQVVFRHSWPYLIIIILSLAFFYPYWLKGLLPIPADILVGAYFPWLDSKWGLPVGVPIKNPMPSDVISMLYPWRSMGMQMLKSGQLPLWDPTILLGTPLLANPQSALLNPLNLLYFFLSSGTAWSIQIILQPVLTGLAAYLFLRNLSISKPSSVFGALAFSFSGFTIVWMEYNTIGYTIVFIPLVLLLLDKIAVNLKIFHLLLLAVFFGLQFFAGYPQIYIYTFLFSGLYFLYRLYENGHPVVFKLAIYVLSLIFGLSLAAVQLIPSLELLNLSIRSVDATAQAANIQFLPLKHLITLMVPDFFGNPGSGNYWSLGSYDNFAFSIPTAALFLFSFAILSKKTYGRHFLIFIPLLVLSLILSLQNPLSLFFTRLPVLGLNSAVATRILVFFDLFLVVIASFGLDLFVLDTQRMNLKKCILLAAIVGIALGTFISTYIQKNNLKSITGQMLVIDPDLTKDFLKIIENYLVAARNLILPGICIIVLFIVSIVYPKKPKLLLLTIFALLILDIFHSTNKYLSFTNPKFLYPMMNSLEFLQNNLGSNRFDRENGEIMPSNVWAPYGLKAVSGQNAVYPLANSKYFSVINGMPNDFASRFVDITNTNSPLYNTLGIKYLAVIKRNEKLSNPDALGQPFKKYLIPRFKEAANFGTVRILENLDNLGIAWFSHKSRCASDQSKVIQIITQPGYKPKDLMVIGCPFDHDIQTDQIGAANVNKESPNILEITVDNPVENYLNISKTFFPGWEVYIDGVKSVLYPSNLALSSVLVPSGLHQVKLIYKPESFYLGLKISGGTIILLVFILLVCYWEKLRSIMRL